MRPGTREHRRRILQGTLALALIVLLGGCMRIQADYTLGEDDTVSGSMVMAVSDDVAETLGQDPADLWDSMSSDMGDDMPAGASVAPYAEDGYTGSQFTFEDAPLSTVGDDEDFQVEHVGDEYVVSGSMDLTEEGVTDGETGSVPTDLLSSLDVRISVTFPGAVTEHTGELDGPNTVVWTPVYGEVTDISARGSAVADGGAAEGGSTAEDSDADSDGGVAAVLGGSDDDSGLSLPAALGVGVGVLAVAGIVTALVLRNRRRSAAAAGGTAQEHPAEG